MAYRIEGKDIVISGFEDGIASDPYTGIADMRNANIVSVPGEASVNFKTAAMTIPPTVSAVAWTAVGATNVFTVASTTGWYNGMAITVDSSSGGSVATGRVYWVGDLSGVTFKLYKNPSLPVGQLLDVTADSNGTLSSYTLGKPIDKTIAWDPSSVTYRYEFILDDNGRVWWIQNTGGTPTNALVYLGNDTLTGTTGRAICVYLNYLIVFRSSTQDALSLGSIEGDVDLDAAFGSGGWLYGWNSVSGSTLTPRPVLVATDNAMYYANGAARLGSIIQNAGSTFNPNTAATYTENTTALAIPEDDNVTAISQLGVNLLIGGEQQFVYPWDRISTSFSYPLILPENYTTRIVGTNSNAYIFAGNRGRIYVTNGTNIDLWKKIPDYITGVVEPYIAWGDAQYWRNQIYFSFTASTNAGVALNNMSGLWAVDLVSDAFRLTNQLSYGAYTGATTVILPNVLTSTPGGAGLYAGWENSGTYGVDYGSTAPYSNLETQIDTDMIPVGTYLNPLSPAQVEWKTSYPIGVNGTAETVSLWYRTALNQSFVNIGSTVVTGSSAVHTDGQGTTTNTVATTSGTGESQPAVSDFYTVNFQKAQWIQLRVLMSSNAVTPTYNRLTEIRLRNVPE